MFVLFPTVKCHRDVPQEQQAPMATANIMEREWPLQHPLMTNPQTLPLAMATVVAKNSTVSFCNGSVFKKKGFI